MSDSCPCGSTLAYAACCGPWHAGASAPTAEALMRSRYCAFVRRDAGHLARTSHPLLRSKLSARDLHSSFALEWCGLEIVATTGGGEADQEGMVEFRARFRSGGKEQVHAERSRFVRIAGEWLYRDGKG
jgi:SEC-C motif-containing protein